MDTLKPKTSGTIAAEASRWSHMIDNYACKSGIKYQPVSWLLTGLVLLLGAGWLMAHPYMGLWHDTRLYAVDALASLRPGFYTRDLFLEFGSQGQFTLFPILFAALISQLGLDNAAFILALMGKLLWLAALIVLARRVEQSWVWVFGLLLVFAYPAYYDSHMVFSYGESFATPRVYAEALSMLALAAWLGSKLTLAWTLVVLAGLLHPLMAIPVTSLFGLLTCYLYRHSPRAAWPMVVGVACAGIILFWIPELRERVVSTYDAAWLEAIRLRNPYVFLDQWSNLTFGHMVWIGLILGLCACRLPAVIARVAGATLSITVGLIMLAWLGASVWENVLLTQLQLWRVMWLAQLLALLLLGGLLPRLWRSDYCDRVLAASLVGALLLDGWSSVFMTITGIILGQVFRRVGTQIDTGTFPWKALPFLLPLPLIVLHLLTLPYWFTVNNILFDKPIWRTLAVEGIVTLALVAAFYWAAPRVGMRTARWLAGFGATAMLAAVLTWTPHDISLVRTSWKPIYAQLRDRIPPGSVVAAPVADAASLIWFDLGRASYISQAQTAGSLFNRDTALEGVRRLKMMQAAGFPYSALAWDDTGQMQESHLSVQSVMRLCGDENLDFVLMSGPWDSAEQYSNRGRVVYSLYACKDLRLQNILPKHRQNT